MFIVDTGKQFPNDPIEITGEERQKTQFKNSLK